MYFIILHYNTLSEYYYIMNTNNVPNFKSRGICIDICVRVPIPITIRLKGIIFHDNLLFIKQLPIGNCTELLKMIANGSKISETFSFKMRKITLQIQEHQCIRLLS